MIDPAIQDFLKERKEKWLKGKIKNNTSEQDKAKLEKNASDQFSLSQWLPNAAKRASQLSIVSHAAKYSHPNAKATTIIANAKTESDGLLRSGNVKADLDVLGNAAALDVYAFLFITLKDGKTILEHLEQKTDTIREQFTLTGVDFNEIVEGLLKIKKTDEKQRTHSFIRQVYFPIADNKYHLLSLLTPSGIMYELKQRIKNLRGSDKTKESREKRKNNERGEDYSEIYNLTSVGYGGTKPQNISVLNSRNHGVAYLLNSSPPVFGARSLNPPHHNFFDVNYTAPVKHKDQFEKFHKTLQISINNINIRHRIKGLVKSIFYDLIEKSWQIRYLDPGWSDSDRYVKLPKNQKIWLDQKYKDARIKEDEWLDGIQEEMVRWFVLGYERVIGKEATKLSDYEFIELKKWLGECGEGLI